jgi:aminocarboxymuconate-semialdehyde decarboxylase
MAELCRAHPRHYAGVGTVPLQSPQLAIRELERCMDELGLSGRADRFAHQRRTGTSTRRNCSSSSRPPATCGAAILMHPWDMMGTESMPKYWLPWLVGMPAEQIARGVLR